MKIGIGADTQDFDKGARKVQQEMKDLNKVSSDALSSIGAALGIDTGKVQQLASAMSGLANKFTRAGADGVSAFSQVSGAIATVGAGIAALGLAAAYGRSLIVQTADRNGKSRIVRTCVECFVC